MPEVRSWSGAEYDRLSTPMEAMGREVLERLVLEVHTAGEDMSERSRCTVLLLPVDGGTRLELTVEGLSGELTAEQMRTGWQWCLEGLAEHLGTAAR